MIRLASLIDTFEADYLAAYGDGMLPSQRKALSALKICRTSAAPVMQMHCEACGHVEVIPHSCGHRSCPHCQNHESQRWIERQQARLVPAEYFLVTFTLPASLRPLAWANQRTLYDLMTRCAWETLRTFAHNDAALRGEAGAIAVLHTHSRRLDYHPHVHVVMPAAAIDAKGRRWHTKRRSKHGAGRGRYLFSHKALAKVFRGKLLAAVTAAGLSLPSACPKDWVVDCKHVGSGEKALVYLGRYLYRGVIREQDILACENGQVTFRYRHAKRNRWEYRTLPGAQFLALVLRHVLPKGFRRARNFGFLHPNSKRSITLLHYLFGMVVKRTPADEKPRPQLRCRCCGASMRITGVGMPPRPRSDGAPPLPLHAAEAAVM